jgi:hypothetical protein
MRRRRNPEIIAGRVNSDGTVTGPTDLVIAKNGTGIYNVILPSGFRMLSVHITPSDNTQFKIGIIQAPNVTGATVAAVLGTIAGAASDTTFYLTIVGVRQ